jgi:hypothetical protein
MRQDTLYSIPSVSSIEGPSLQSGGAAPQARSWTEVAAVKAAAARGRVVRLGVNVPPVGLGSARAAATPDCVDDGVTGAG